MFFSVQFDLKPQARMIPSKIRRKEGFGVCIMKHSEDWLFLHSKKDNNFQEYSKPYLMVPSSSIRKSKTKYEQ
jgi:hypothetical protein